MTQLLGYAAPVDEKTEALRWRAWQAYHQLPYADDGRLPSQRSLEVGPDGEQVLPNGTFTKLFRGRLKRPGPEIQRKVAEVLRVDRDWLWEGRGAGPLIVRGAGPLPKVSRSVPVVSDGGREGSALRQAGTRSVSEIPRKRR
jgi:hypothetical protein